MKYLVDCSWTVFGTIEVEAESETEAKDIALDAPLSDFDTSYDIDDFTIQNVIAEGEEE